MVDTISFSWTTVNWVVHRVMYRLWTMCHISVDVLAIIWITYETAVWLLKVALDIRWVPSFVDYWKTIYSLNSTKLLVTNCSNTRDHTLIIQSIYLALDPALPLIFRDIRLKRSSARSVHVLQTNAGHFGDVGNIGDVNVCVNGGLIQPYCAGVSRKLILSSKSTQKNMTCDFLILDPNLCSHIFAICYMSQSLFDEFPLVGRKCSTYCPKAGIFQFFTSHSLENTYKEIQVINDVPEL